MLVLPNLEFSKAQETLTSGEGNALFYYCSLDAQTGVVLAADAGLPAAADALENSSIRSRVHAACHKIRATLLRAEAASLAAPTEDVARFGPTSDRHGLHFHRVRPTTHAAPASPMDPLVASGDGRALLTRCWLTAPQRAFSQGGLEHGILFTVDAQPETEQPLNPAAAAALSARRRTKQLKRTALLPGDQAGYWVVGRLYDRPDPEDAHGGAEPLPPREFYVCYRDGTSQDVAEMAHLLHLGVPA